MPAGAPWSPGCALVPRSGRLLTPGQVPAYKDDRPAEDLLDPQDLPDEDDALDSS